MQLHRIHAEIHRDNLASLNLIQRLGFQFEGVHREMGFWQQRWHDLDYYSSAGTRMARANSRINPRLSPLPLDGKPPAHHLIFSKQNIYVDSFRFFLEQSRK